MQYLWLLVIIVMISAQSVLSKQYDSMTKEANIFFFSTVTSFVAMAFFIVQSGFKLTFSMDYLLYSVGFGLSYVICIGTSFLAIIWGSMSITGLVLAYSLVIPTFYGLFVLDENIGIIGMLGIGCLLISIFLINDIKGEIYYLFVGSICQ